MPLVAIAGVPSLLGAYLLLSPPVVFSREMTWDLLFNLEGAWNLFEGQTLHVDVHDPLGIIPFLLTEIGFSLSGVGPQAFLVGVLLYAAFIFVAAICILAPRLPTPAASIAVFYVTLLVLVPINIGDDPSIYTFAMSYNRFGWSSLVLLFLLLVIPPDRARRSDAIDVIIAAALLVALFYLKITYFLAGIAAVVAALLLAPHLRRKIGAWLGVLGLIAAIAAAPFNLPYWRDIWAAVMSGAVRADPLSSVKSALMSETETGLLLVELLCLVWLWRRRQIGGCEIALALFVAACGVFVLSQNAQTSGVPLYIVISFMLFDALRRAQLRQRLWFGRDVRPLLLACLTVPALSIASMTMSLAGYWQKARQPAGMVMEETQLRGLAVRADPADLIADFSRGTVSPQTLIAARQEHPRWDLTQAEYLETLRDALAIFGDDRDGLHFGAAPRIMLFDAVNPLPFALGFPPPRGGDLWFDPVFPWPPGAEALADVDVVLVPKFSSRATDMAMARYGDYLRAHFSLDRETVSWLVYRRGADDPALSDRN